MLRVPVFGDVEEVDMMLGRFIAAGWLWIGLITISFAQGQDGTPAQRDIMIISALLPGHFSNANQAYFDVRLKRPEPKRHAALDVEVEKLGTDIFGSAAFLARRTLGTGEARRTTRFVYAFYVDDVAGAVRMKTYHLKGRAEGRIKKRDATYLGGCDLLWQQEAGQFRGVLEGRRCISHEGDEMPAYKMLLSQDAFWLQFSDRQVGFYALDRARQFQCYVDVPGVGGGRDIPFERLEMGKLHDLGGEAWGTTKDGTEIGVNLFRVMWTFNNYDGVFARPSFVMYVKTKDEADTAKEVAYAFTAPDAQRIGLNLKWALAQCFMLSNKAIEPFFKNDEPKVK